MKPASTTTYQRILKCLILAFFLPSLLFADTWTDRTGKTIEAEFRGFTKSLETPPDNPVKIGVMLESDDRVMRTFPLQEFAPEEWQHLRKMGADHTIRLVQQQLPVFALYAVLYYLGHMLTLWFAASLLKSQRGFGNAARMTGVMLLLSILILVVNFFGLAGTLPLIGLQIFSVALLIVAIALYFGFYECGCWGTLILVIVHGVFLSVWMLVQAWVINSFFDLSAFSIHLWNWYVVCSLDMSILPAL
ncbi:MAG: hypothetical protein ACI9TH_003682 [Kiritimatiellia bacterium]|jgi:hypothetical protein